jgi:PPOX class probable F420-dependent enzyme
MNLSAADVLERFALARVARLATVSVAGQPHLVPVTFALWGEVIVLAVDHKPKTTINLKRLRNISETGRVCLLADEYSDADWSRLWWVRADGTAHLVEDGQERVELLEPLCAKYRQYRERPPTGPVTRVDIQALTGWTYSG